MHVSKAKQGIRLLLPIDKQMFSCFRKAELIVCNGSLGGQTASLPLLHWLKLQSIMLCGMRCLLGQSGSAVLAEQLLVHPSLLAEQHEKFVCLLTSTCSV